MSRVEENKLLKKNNLMNTAFQLFTSQGLAKTSISDIVERAGVAKGTFYLYFKDKYDLHEKLVIHQSEQLFQHALEQSGYQNAETSADKLIAIIDDILYQLQKNSLLLQFINKNLSWGVFRRAINKWEPDYPAIFEEILGTSPADRKTLEIEVYTILELVGSTCHSVILNSDPVGLDTYLPYLHRSIRAIMAGFAAG
ncbi:MAG: TetR/AcrR family transcriptional regulator [Oscillospiraceae bacterium]|nr:TetR/AcrR family transcriptional regulator [Oscillospiraceae bacterium]